jgi:membrane protease YdiL (CAAX protease family)
MKEFLKALSGRAEFLIVVLGAFGLFLLSNLVLLLDPSAISAVPPITNDQLQQTVYYEIVALSVLGAFLRARKWTFERLGIGADLRDTIIGVGLMVLVYVISAVIQTIAASVAPSIVETAAKVLRLGEPLGLGTVAVTSLVNSVFEEVFVCAYVIAALREKRGVAVAVNVSVALRVTYHLYQGALGALTIAPIGLLFAYWYVRSGRLWPVIVAHALLDFIGLLQLGEQS